MNFNVFLCIRNDVLFASIHILALFLHKYGCFVFSTNAGSSGTPCRTQSKGDRGVTENAHARGCAAPAANTPSLRKLAHAASFEQNDTGKNPSLVRRIAVWLMYELKTHGFTQTLRSFVISARCMVYLKKNIALFALPLVYRYIAISNDANQLFHIRHRNYLCRGFSLCARVDSALSHYRFENDFHDEEYQDLVYRDGGLVLWSALLHGTRYEIRLRGSIKNRHEGGTSIVMLVDGTTVLNEFSYAWVDTVLVNAAGSGVVPLITRNQSIRHDVAAMQVFRTDFPQHSPHYFCLAAMQGIALAHGHKALAAIKHDHQIAFSQQYEKSFRRSYSDLWQSFGAHDLGPNAYLMHLPLALRPLDQVSSKHRKRAAMRRQQWKSIAESAVASLAPHIIG